MRVRLSHEPGYSGTVATDLHEAEVALQQKKANAKLLQFAPKKPVRSA